MKNKVVKIILLMSVLIITAFWVQEMTTSSILFWDRIDSFLLIYIPLIFFIFSALFYLRKYWISKDRMLKHLLFFSGFLVVLIIFLLFSFGQKSFVCYSGNCIDGNGVGLYISSERSSVMVETGDTSYNNGHILGYAFFNNITWYDRNPIKEIYIGQYRNGRFHGIGEIYSFIYKYNDITYKPIKIIGGFMCKGEFGNGWLYWDRPSRIDFEFGERYAKDLLKKYKLDSLGYPL
jgi:hypothetical protein